jgi:hypothetical protein
MKVLILAAALMTSTFLNAEEPLNNTCASDVQKFCSKVQEGEARILKCLREHEKDLSPLCVAVITENKAKFENNIRAKAQEMISNCREDAKKLCSNVPGRKVNCLKDKKDELSEKCKSAMF